MNVLIIICLVVVVIALLTWRIIFGYRSMQRRREHPESVRRTTPGAWIVIGVVVLICVVLLVVSSMR